GRPGAKPCIIFLSGADALPEENLFRGVQHITRRGCFCFLVNGPGQGSTLRLLKIGAIHDFERVVAASIDYLTSRDDIRADSIGLLGVSFAGYYSMRAAALEKRLKACVAWGALYDVLNDLYLHYPPLRAQLIWIAQAANDEQARRIYAKFTLK